MDPLRLGTVPTGLGTADLFVTVEANAHPLLRIDLYRSSDEESAFTEVQVWAKSIAIGWGEHFYLVDPATRRTADILLGSYFGQIYAEESHLLVASAERLFCVSPNGNLLWRSDQLGIDGVVVERVTDTVIEGEGEWDPPGGWRPFLISLRDGRGA